MIITKSHLFFLDGENCGSWLKVSAKDVWATYGKFLNCTIKWTDNFSLRGTVEYKMMCDREKMHYSFEDWQKKIEVEAKDCISIKFGNELLYKVRSFYECFREGEDGFLRSDSSEFDREKDVEITLYPNIGYRRMLVAKYEQERYQLVNYPIVDNLFFGTEKTVKLSSRDFEVAKYL